MLPLFMDCTFLSLRFSLTFNYQTYGYYHHTLSDLRILSPYLIRPTDITTIPYQTYGYYHHTLSDLRILPPYFIRPTDIVNFVLICTLHKNIYLSTKRGVNLYNFCGKIGQINDLAGNFGK
jgi:hypothetical protein